MEIFNDEWKNRKWALMTPAEAKKYGYGCEICLDVIAKARKVKARRVLGYQWPAIAPKWEIVAIWP